MVRQTVRPADDPVLDALRRAIVRGEIPAGARVIERELAADLGVSRTPVREALARLRSDGLLSATVGRQRNLLRVAPLTLRELRQASAATAALEGIGAAEATAQPKDARETLAGRLDAVIDSVGEEMTPGRGSFARALQLDERFHRLLADEFLEPSVAVCLESARIHVYRYVWMFSVKTGVNVARFEAEHKPIVAALRRGNAADVRAGLGANWSGFATRIAPFLRDAR